MTVLNRRRLEERVEGASPRPVWCAVLAAWVAMVVVGCVEDAGVDRSSAQGECVSASTPPTLLEAVVVIDPLCRSRLLTDALEGLGPDGVPAVLDFLAGHHVIVDYASLDLILGWSTRIDPDRAYRALDSIPGRRRRPALRVVYEHWAEVDPEGAAAHLKTIPRPRQLEGSALSIAQGWERSGEPGLAAFIAEQRIEMIRTEILETVLTRRVLRDGTASVREWLTGTTADAADAARVTEAFRIEAHAVGASAMAGANLDAAREWADQIEDPTLQSAAVAAVAIRWLEDDASAALAWVVARPAASVRDPALKDAFDAFAERDRRAAIQWFDARGGGDVFSPLLEAYLRHLAEVDAGAAIVRVHEIENERQRATALRSIFVTWRAQDARAADEWLASAGVSDETRRVLMQTARRRSGL
jgi:hypothetical protein